MIVFEVLMFVIFRCLCLTRVSVTEWITSFSRLPPTLDSFALGPPAASATTSVTPAARMIRVTMVCQASPSGLACLETPSRSPSASTLRHTPAVVASRASAAVHLIELTACSFAVHASGPESQ